MSGILLFLACLCVNMLLRIIAGKCKDKWAVFNNSITHVVYYIIYLVYNNSFIRSKLLLLCCYEMKMLS